MFWIMLGVAVIYYFLDKQQGVQGTQYNALPEGTIFNSMKEPKPVGKPPAVGTLTELKYSGIKFYSSPQGQWIWFEGSNDWEYFPVAQTQIHI